MAFDYKTFHHENGWFVTIATIVAGVWRRIHNRALAASLPGQPRINIHPSAYIRGMRHIKLGEGFRAGRHLWLEAVTRDDDQVYTPRLEIGRNVIINDDVHIAATHLVSIGDDVLLASRIYISDHGHGDYQSPGGADPEVAPRLRKVGSASHVIIEANVWIGEMVSVLPGVTIGRGSVIGANSVVTRDIPPFCIAAGAPARVIKRFDRESGVWQRV